MRQHRTSIAIIGALTTAVAACTAEVEPVSDVRIVAGTDHHELIAIRNGERLARSVRCGPEAGMCEPSWTEGALGCAAREPGVVCHARFSYALLASDPDRLSDAEVIAGASVHLVPRSAVRGECGATPALVAGSAIIREALGSSRLLKRVAITDGNHYGIMSIPAEAVAALGDEMYEEEEEGLTCKCTKGSGKCEVGSQGDAQYCERKDGCRACTGSDRDDDGGGDGGGEIEL
jgi:hypothetical protein